MNHAPTLIDRLACALSGRRQITHITDEISRLLKPSGGILRAAIDMDNAQLLKSCIAAGVEPTIEDLKLAITARCRSRRGNHRWYSYRENVIDVLKDRIRGNPDLSDVLQADLRRIRHASKCGLVVQEVMGVAAVHALFPNVDATIQTCGDRSHLPQRDELEVRGIDAAERHEIAAQAV